jgi:hypothetical protein
MAHDGPGIGFKKGSWRVWWCVPPPRTVGADPAAAAAGGTWVEAACMAHDGPGIGFKKGSWRVPPPRTGGATLAFLGRPNRAGGSWLCRIGRARPCPPPREPRDPLPRRGIQMRFAWLPGKVKKKNHS